MEGQPLNIYLPEVTSELVSKTAFGFCANIGVSNNRDNTSYRMNWEVKVYTPATITEINAGLGQKMEEVEPFSYLLTGHPLEVGEKVTVEFCADNNTSLSNATMVEVSEIGGNGWHEWVSIVDGLIDERKNLLVETVKDAEKEMARICRERLFSDFVLLTSNEEIHRYKSFYFERVIGFCHN